MENSSVYSDGLYPKLLIQTLHEMRSSGTLCDVILVCDGEIPAHRVILSAACPYFRGMFNLGLKESKEERIEISCMDGVVLRAAVDFIYSGKIAVPDDVILPLLEASSLLQLGALRSACLEKLCRTANPCSTLESCGSIANRMGLQELETFIHRLTIENFETLVFGDHKEQWLDAPYEAIHPLLNYFVINTQPVALVIKAVMEWILHDPTGNRAGHLEALLRGISDLGESDVKQGIRDLLNDKPGLHQRLLSLCKPEHQVSKKGNMKELEVVVAVGGLSQNTALKTVECYMVDSQASGPWTLYLPDVSGTCSDPGSNLKTGVQDRVVPAMRFPRVYAASAFSDHEIFIIGGESGSFPMRSEASVECYNIISNTWSTLPGIPLSESQIEENEENSEDVHVRLSGAAASLVEGELYVLGGRLDTVDEGEKEVYYPPSKWIIPHGLSKETWVYNKGKCRWRRCCYMQQSRAYHGAASINGVLYAVGGIGAASDGHFTECLDSVERYDPWDGVWRRVNTLPAPRAYFGCITSCQYIYVIGGHNLDCCKDTVFKYDTIKDSWNFIEHPLRTPIDSLAVCSLKYPASSAKISPHSFLIGGRNSHNGLRHANVYNFATNRWHCLQSLLQDRIGASAGILRLPVYSSTSP